MDRRTGTAPWKNRRVARSSAIRRRISTNPWTAVALAVIMGLAGVALAVTYLVNPAHCDSQPMQPGDRCHTWGSRGSLERLERSPDASGRTPEQQKSHNETWGAIYLAAGLMFIAAAAALTYDATRKRGGRHRRGSSRKQSGPET